VKYNTTDFATLYALVTTALREFVHAAKSQGTVSLSYEDEQWLAYLLMIT